MLKTQRGLVRDSPRGLRLDVLITTENAGGCKFFRTQCNHCNMPDLGRGTEPSKNHETLVSAVTGLGELSQKIKQINVYSSGNVLDRDEITDETFEFALNLLARNFLVVECVGMDARPEIVLSETGMERIGRARTMLDGIRIEPIIGYETQDERIRMGKDGLNKKITEAKMEAVFRLVKENGLGLQVNIMLMPVPTMSLRDAMTEAVLSIRHIHAMKERFGVRHVLVNLHPLFVSRKMIDKWGTEVLDRPLPTDHEINEVVEVCKHLLPIFVGRYDEGLAVKKAYSD